jgi:hypothetical protein
MTQLSSLSTVQKLAEQQETRTRNMEVAKTILQQLGGNKFRAMTGAKNFVAIDDGISFKISKAKNGINCIQIKLNGRDLYDVSYMRIHGTKVTTISNDSDASFDMLQTLFTQATGLYTYL